MMAGMEPVQIDFPPDWDEAIKTRVAERGKTSVADYLRELVAADIEPQELDEATERLILEGLDSGPAEPIDAAFWAERRRKLHESLKARQAAT